MARTNQTSPASQAKKTAKAATVTKQAAQPKPCRDAKRSQVEQQLEEKAPQELTDAEVLSMPDAEYMNDVQLAFFKHKLQLLRQEILSYAGETAEHLREDAVVVPDPADRAYD